MTALSYDVSSIVSWSAMVSTGWALASMKTRWPWSSRVRVASSSWTVWRRLRNQYEPSSSVPSSGCPVTVERKGTLTARGVSEDRASRSSSRRLSTCAEWEA